MVDNFCENWRNIEIILNSMAMDDDWYKRLHVTNIPVHNFQYDSMVSPVVTTLEITGLF